jgi:hypothetical protein
LFLWVLPTWDGDPPGRSLMDPWQWIIGAICKWY